MKTHYKWQYLTLAGVLTLAGCTTSRQTAQTGEADDLYGTSANATVYASASSDDQPSRRSSQPYTPRTSRRTSDQYARNTNPDYVDGQIGDGGQIDYYTDSLTSRKLQRGLSPDPGWGDAYDQGYSNGFNSALAYNNPYFNSSRWNQWGGFGGSSFYGGLGLGLGIGSAFGYSPFYSPFGFGRFSPFYSPFGFNNFAYSPFDYGFGFSPFGYGFNNFYSPYGFGGGFGGFGGGYGNYFGRTVVYNNAVIGADPYRNNRTYGPRNTASSNRYNSDFVNAAPRNANAGGRRASDYSGSYNNSGTGNNNRTANGGSSAYYSRPANGGSSRGSYYYGAPANTSSARTGSAGTGNSSNNTYYSRPGNSGSSSRSNYSAPSTNGGSSYGGSSRGSYQQPSSQSQSRSYSQPSTQSQSRSYSQPSYSAPSNSSRGSYSAPSAPSGGGGGRSSGGGGGSTRGPR